MDHHIECIREDFLVYWNKRGTESSIQSFLYLLTTHGLHIMLLFRLSKIIYSIKIPVLSHILKILFQLIWFLTTTFYGIWIDLSSDIGRGFYIGHFGGIIIRGNFGDYCSIGQGVTVGSKGAGKSDGWPIIGDNVYIGAGAKIIGSIKLGDGVIVGANAVVLEDVPKASLAVGIPAKFKKIKS
ncbi:MAG: DapH/DapD/GlmU-related protein [Methylococcales bacterium]